LQSACSFAIGVFSARQTGRVSAHRTFTIPLLTHYGFTRAVQTGDVLIPLFSQLMPTEADRSGAAEPNHNALKDTGVRSALVLSFAIVILSLVCLSIYNGIEQLHISKNHHELVRRQKLLRKHNLLRQYDRDHNKVIDQDEANFGSLNSYQF
jgi:hypothetical protein